MAARSATISLLDGPSGTTLLLGLCRTLIYAVLKVLHYAAHCTFVAKRGPAECYYLLLGPSTPRQNNELTKIPHYNRDEYVFVGRPVLAI